MFYTVKKLADLASISVKTLHHYHKMGLLVPTHVKPNGYRYYEEKDLMRLQQILFFKELEFSLNDIKAMLNSPDFDTLEALRGQKKMLKIKGERLNELLKNITNTINAMKKKKLIKDKELYDAFSDEKMEEYRKEAKERWGHTEAWRQSEQRTKGWTKEDHARVQAEGGAILEEIVKNMDKGMKSAEVQTQIPKYREHLSTYYDISVEMFRGLGNMYSDDPRFAAYYEKIHPGLAQFMTRAINYYCDEKG